MHEGYRGVAHRVEADTVVCNLFRHPKPVIRLKRRLSAYSYIVQGLSYTS